MNFRARFYKPVLVALAAVLFCGSSQMQARLNKDRAAYGFTRLAPLSNAPPMLAFTTVALGGFRGLISNALWMRATELQDQERYFEMVQLADWITTLEPHYSEVWRMQAWNMAYNISVKCKNFEERWRWVQRGIQLLHKGLQYNPGDAKIYQDLSWIFRHKIGQNLDDAHRLYKIRWAQQMQDLLGGHPDFAALLHPQTPAERERVRKLREDYHMDPAFIEHIDQTYGPLDWRLPDAHAIYWAEMGVRNGTQEDRDLVRRFAYAIMQQACRRGGALPSWITNVTEENFILWPNLDLVSKVNASYEQTKLERTDKKIVQNAQKNFLKEAVVLLYEYNRTREASEWFNYLKANFTNAITGDDTNLTVEEYAFKQIQSEIGELDQPKVTSVILGLISQEYLCLIGEDETRAENFRRLAEAIWHSYMSRLPGGPQDPNAQRIALDPLLQLRRYELEQMEGYLSPQNANYLRAKLGFGPRAPAAPPPGQPPASGRERA
ncbi:MAG: hypothetical protein ABSG78_01100 [Verrucomicrobiota bacterium]|jgi:hypothetical protein